MAEPYASLNSNAGAESESPGADMFMLQAEDEAVRFRTQAALDALAKDLAEVRLVSVEENSLDDWRAEMKLKMDALSAELDKELEEHVPEPLFEYDWSLRSNDYSDASAAGAPAAAPDAVTSERGDVMAELARREATRSELLASLMR